MRLSSIRKRPEIKVVLQLPVPVTEAVGFIHEEENDRQPERGLLEKDNFGGDPAPFRIRDHENIADPQYAGFQGLEHEDDECRAEHNALNTSYTPDEDDSHPKEGIEPLVMLRADKKQSADVERPCDSGEESRHKKSQQLVGHYVYAH